MELHEQLRVISRNMDISEQLKSEPMSSPFAIALLKAECVLLAVDETFEPLTRSWCGSAQTKQDLPGGSKVLRCLGKNRLLE